MSLPDVVYIVRPGERNQELRYSLRSLTNLPHRRVWIVGHKPRWVTGVVHLPTTQHPEQAAKRDNAWLNMLALAACDDLPQRLVYMDDDYYILEPLEQVPVLNRGTIGAHRDHYLATYRESAYTELLAATARMLGDQALSFDMHVPFPVRRDLLADVITEVDQAGHPRPLWRTVYGARAGYTGATVEDVKVYDRDAPAPDPGAALLSTCDGTWWTHGRTHVAPHFPTPSRYERG